MFSPVAGVNHIQVAGAATGPAQDSARTKKQLTVALDKPDSILLSDGEKAESAALQHEIPDLGVVTHGRVLDAAAVAAYRAREADGPSPESRSA